MDTISDFSGLTQRFLDLKPVRRVAVVCPDDEPTIAVIKRCLQNRAALFRLVARADRAEAARALAAEHPDSVTLTIAENPDQASAEAVRMVRSGEADVLFKGNVNTDNLLRAVLNHEYGLLPEGQVLSHVALAQIPGREKLLMFSDAAVIPEPDLRQLEAMLRYDTDLCRRIGITNPAVALIHFTEKFNDRFACTTYYRTILQRAESGVYGSGLSIGGPMDVKSACDAHAAAIKGIESPVVGRADLLLFPSLVAANTFYKTLALFAHAELAAILTGTTAPVVVPSRADSDESKFLSLALACVATGHS